MKTRHLVPVGDMTILRIDTKERLRIAMWGLDIRCLGLGDL